ncbi:MAG: TerB family tellurite resistance protein [Pseudomonadota bacterium]
MHVIIAFITAVVSLLWALHRLAEMGIDLGGLNPMAWRRRRKWRKQFEGNPIFSIDDPMEVTALLATAVAKAEGDMTSGEKQSLLEIFQAEFSLSEADARELLTSSAHLLGPGDEVRNDLGGILKPSTERFSASQAKAALALLERVAEVDGSQSPGQAELIERVRAIFAKQQKSEDNWGQPAA